jgi:peptidoglycan/LPS O-acetylase OafA/YrhL
MTIAPQSRSRLHFLDSLRGIAACSVFFAHAAARWSESFRDFHSQLFQMGQFGVSLFFLCSGFVIPFSLERGRGLRAFWVKRFFRLYPLYWFSLACALALGWLGGMSLPEAFTQRYWVSVVGNLTMVQGFLGIEHALSPYWSLGFEMIFYGLASLLFATGLLKRTVWVALALMLLSILNPAVFRFVLHRPAKVGSIFHFATLFYGTCIYRAYRGEISRAVFSAVTALALFTVVASAGLGFYGNEDPAYGGMRSFWPMTTAWLGAYLVFLTGYALRDARWIGALSGLGVISYSIYLMHPMVVGSLPVEWSAAWALLACSALTWGVSQLTYRWIEQPLMK